MTKNHQCPRDQINAGPVDLRIASALRDGARKVAGEDLTLLRHCAADRWTLREGRSDALKPVRQVVQNDVVLRAVYHGLGLGPYKSKVI